MRHELDAWNLFMQTENSGENLTRFLIAFDELRARLAPSKYPNVEITDEGCLWFNVDTFMGNCEIIGVPFEFKDLKASSIIISFPRKADDINGKFLNKLCYIGDKMSELTLFAGTSPTIETLQAYQQNILPPLTIAHSYDEIYNPKRKGVFFNYLGIAFSITDKNVSKVENVIKQILYELGKNT